MNSELIKNFIAFSKEYGNAFADFEFLEEDNKTTFLQPNALDSFVLLGQHGSGSQILIWNIFDDKNLENNPVIWMDSEGEPISVFAKNFNDFFKKLF